MDRTGMVLGMLPWTDIMLAVRRESLHTEFAWDGFAWTNGIGVIRVGTFRVGMKHKVTNS